MEHASKIDILRRKGVYIPNPETVLVGEEVDVDRISANGVRIFAGCKLTGAGTFIADNVTLGLEGPATVEDCQVGPGVSLKGGFFQRAVFLEGAAMGSGAHVREGTILEEQASGAHTVGLKQTILFPFVTLGSLINFCDCLMTGGTGRKDHSEVGSSYIHFNYTPNQDKATASLLGDVPKGVMLNQPPVFLGGQGGLVGPCRLAFGTVIAAGSIYRKDELRPNRLLIGGAGRAGSLPHAAGVYQNVKRIVVGNVIYMANLLALKRWYLDVRSRFTGPTFPEPLFQGLLEKLETAIAERIQRFGGFVDKLPESLALYRERAGANAAETLIRQKTELVEKWPAMAADLSAHDPGLGDPALRDGFLRRIDAGIQSKGMDYLAVIQQLSETDAATGAAWLEGIVSAVRDKLLGHLPSIGGTPGG